MKDKFNIEIEVNNISYYAKEEAATRPWLVVKLVEGEWWYESCWKDKDAAENQCLELRIFGVNGIVIKNEVAK